MYAYQVACGQDCSDDGFVTYKRFDTEVELNVFALSDEAHLVNFARKFRFAIEDPKGITELKFNDGAWSEACRIILRMSDKSGCKGFMEEK